MYLKFESVYGQEVRIASEEMEIKVLRTAKGKCIVLHGNNTYLISEEEYEKLTEEMDRQYRGQFMVDADNKRKSAEEEEGDLGKWLDEL